MCCRVPFPECIVSSRENIFVNIYNMQMDIQIVVPFRSRRCARFDLSVEWICATSYLYTFPSGTRYPLLVYYPKEIYEDYCA